MEQINYKNYLGTGNYKTEITYPNKILPKDLTTNVHTPNISKILFISSAENFDIFTNRYGYLEGNIIGIDWPRVANDYLGIALDTDLWDGKFLMAKYRGKEYISWWDNEYYEGKFFIFTNSDKTGQPLDEQKTFDAIDINGNFIGKFIGKTPNVAAKKAYTLMNGDKNLTTESIIFIRDEGCTDKMYKYHVQREEISNPVTICIQNNNDNVVQEIIYSYNGKSNYDKIVRDYP